MILCVAKKAVQLLGKTALPVGVAGRPDTEIPQPEAWSSPSSPEIAPIFVSIALVSAPPLSVPPIPPGPGPAGAPSGTGLAVWWTRQELAASMTGRGQGAFLNRLVAP